MDMKIISRKTITKLHAEITVSMLREAFDIDPNADVFVEYNYGDRLDISDHPIQVYMEITGVESA